jgi:UDP-glucuronate decarboxylase
LKGVPLTVFGEGAQTRSFCYVDDLINGFVSLMNFSGQYDEDDVVFNLGNPREFTIAELAKIIQNLTKSSSELIHQPLPSDDPRQRKPVIDKARQKLGWEPRVQLAQGLEFTIAYFSNLLESNDERLTSKYGSKANQ